MTVVDQWQLSYPQVARALAEEYRALPETEVALIVAEALPGMDLESAEGFFDDIGRALSGPVRAAGPYVAPLASGAATGAATGSVAGPWGALIGAGVGAVTSGIQAGASRRGGPTRPATARPMPTAGPVQAPMPALAQLTGALGGMAGAGGTGAGTAVPQLLSVLGSPTVQQALLAMLMGRAGTRSVATAGGGAVPVAAITNMLASLAGRASEEWEVVAPSGATGAFGEGIDEGSPYARAEWLYEQVLPVELDDDESGADDDQEDGAAWLDETYDNFEAFLESWDEDDYPLEDLGPNSGEAWDEDVDESVRSW